MRHGTHKIARDRQYWLKYGNYMCGEDSLRVRNKKVKKKGKTVTRPLLPAQKVLSFSSYLWCACLSCIYLLKRQIGEGSAKFLWGERQRNSKEANVDELPSGTWKLGTLQGYVEHSKSYGTCKSWLLSTLERAKHVFPEPHFAIEIILNMKRSSIVSTSRLVLKLGGREIVRCWGSCIAHGNHSLAVISSCLNFEYQACTLNTWPKVLC